MKTHLQVRASLSLLAGCCIWLLGALPVPAAEESPWFFKEGKPDGAYLSYEEGTKLAGELQKIKITGCTEANLSLMGLVSLTNTILKAAKRNERVYVAFDDHFVYQPLEKYFAQCESKDKDPFSNFRDKPSGKLNKKNLVEQINQSSVYDLLENLRGWWSSSFTCYTRGLYMESGGDNWPHVNLQGRLRYHLEFQEEDRRKE